MSSHKKYFVLKNIQLDGIDAKYDLLTHQPNVCIPPLQTTDPVSAFRFVDELKNEHKCMAIKSTLQTCTRCWWCRQLLTPNETVITCPVKMQQQFEKTTFYSCAKKTHYDIKERVYTPDAQMVCDGFFCGYPCCIAFIDDNSHNILYKDSMMLLSQRYFLKTGQHLKCLPAPHWRMLKEYGGILTYEEFQVPWIRYDKIDTSVYSMITTIIEKKKKF